MKKKMKIEIIKVKSFTTALESKELKGGSLQCKQESDGNGHCTFAWC